MNIEKKLRDSCFELRKEIQRSENELSYKENILLSLEEKNNKIRELETNQKSNSNNEMLETLNKLYGRVQLGEVESKNEILKEINIIINKTNGYINTNGLKLDSESKTDITLQEEDIHKTKTPRFS